MSIQFLFLFELMPHLILYTGPAKDLYNEDRRIWNAMFEIIVADLRVCQRDGIDCGGNIGRIYPIVLANKGDWSYLAPWCILNIFLFKSAQMVLGLGVFQHHHSTFCSMFINSFLGKRHMFFVVICRKSTSKVSSANLQRSYRRAPKGSGDPNKTGAGVCHLCMAGHGIDWEIVLLGIEKWLYGNVFPG